MNVLQEIQTERERQDAKWGEQNHSPMVWLSILGEEFGEVNRGAQEAYFHNYKSCGDWSSYREELIQVAAVAVAMVESLDRNGYPKEGE